MTVRAILRERQGDVLELWREMIRAADGRAATSLPTRGSDPFHDPVGAAHRHGTAAILEALLGEGEPEAARGGVDEIVRVRSVQAITASEVVGFVFLLRRAVRDTAGAPDESGASREWSSLDARLDAISLQAFQAYADCREKVFEIRARESERANAVLIRRAQRLDGEARLQAESLRAETLPAVGDGTSR